MELTESKERRENLKEFQIFTENYLNDEKSQIYRLLALSTDQIHQFSPLQKWLKKCSKSLKNASKRLEIALKTGFWLIFSVFGVKKVKKWPKTGKNWIFLKKSSILTQNLDFFGFLTSKSENLAFFLSKNGFKVV